MVCGKENTRLCLLELIAQQPRGKVYWVACGVEGMLEASMGKWTMTSHNYHPPNQTPALTLMHSTD